MRYQTVYDAGLCNSRTFNSRTKEEVGCGKAFSHAGGIYAMRRSSILISKLSCIYMYVFILDRYSEVNVSCVLYISNVRSIL